MPYSALFVPESRVVTIDEGGEQPRSRWAPSDLQCHLPGCGLGVTIVTGTEVAHHFRHMGGKCGCDYLDPEQWEESTEHREGKRWVAAWRTRQLRNEGVNASVAYERPFPEIRRIADVCITFPRGWREVHEIQVSGISAEEVRARVRDYSSQGCDVWWWFCPDRGNENRAAREVALSLGTPVGSIESAATWKTLAG